MTQRWTVAVDACDDNSLNVPSCSMPDSLHMSYRDALGWTMRLAAGFGCFIEPMNFEEFPTHADFDCYRLVPVDDYDVYVANVYIKKVSQ